MIRKINGGPEGSFRHKALADPSQTTLWDRSAALFGGEPICILRYKSGPDGSRTHGLHNAIVALSQLSYRPEIPISFN